MWCSCTLTSVSVHSMSSMDYNLFVWDTKHCTIHYTDNIIMEDLRSCIHLLHNIISSDSAGYTVCIHFVFMSDTNCTLLYIKLYTQMEVLPLIITHHAGYKLCPQYGAGVDLGVHAWSALHTLYVVWIASFIQSKIMRAITNPGIGPNITLKENVWLHDAPWDGVSTDYCNCHTIITDASWC